MYAALCEPVVLTICGNVWLRASADQAPPELQQSTALFGAISLLQFGIEDKQLRTGTADWFRYLRAEHAERLSLVLGPFPVAVDAALGRQRDWAIQIAFPHRWEIWKASWSTSPGTKAWQALHRGLGLTSPLPENVPNLTSGGSALERAVVEAEAVSHKMGTEPFTRMFVAARRALQQPWKPDDQLSWLPPVQHNARARRLLVAANRAWVFGGMGSWLDRGPDYGAATREEFEAAYEQLWNAVISAVASATNGYLEPDR